MKGIPFWLIAAGVIGYIIYKKKKAPPVPIHVEHDWPAGIQPEQIVPPEMRYDPSYVPRDDVLIGDKRMNGNLFWIAMAGIGIYLITKKKKTRIRLTRRIPYTRQEYESALETLATTPAEAPAEQIWAEEPAQVIVSYEAEQAAARAEMPDIGIETMGPGMSW
jgi:hypothetical protein